MSKGRLATLWQNLKKTPSIYRQKVVLVGVDNNGNRFYEKPAVPDKSLKGSRWVEPPDGDQWTVPKVSSEWNAWLRERRINPPTEEELERNEIKMLKTRLRADALQQKDVAENENATEVKSLPGSARTPFPTYPEYELSAGDSNKKGDR